MCEKHVSRAPIGQVETQQNCNQFGPIGSKCAWRRGAEIVLFISVLAGFAALTWKLQKWMQTLDVRQDTDVLFGYFRFDFALSSGGRRYIKRKMCEKLMTAKLIVNIWHRFLFTWLFSFNSFLFLCVSSYLLTFCVYSIILHVYIYRK